MERREERIMMKYDERTIVRKGELPECPCINLETLKVQYVDFNDSAIEAKKFRPLSDLLTE